jgi:hypothetical protein
MNALPENRRHNETLRRYVLASQMVAAIAEQILDAADNSPYARALRYALEAQDTALESMRGNLLPAAPSRHPDAMPDWRDDEPAAPAAPAAIADSPDLDPPVRPPAGIYAEILAHGIRPHIAEEV